MPIGKEACEEYAREQGRLAYETLVRRATYTIERSEMASAAKLIPEMDEVQEFIDNVIDGTGFDAHMQLSATKIIGGYSNDTVAKMLSKIAAFSARRAREKAIEECAIKAYQIAKPLPRSNRKYAIVDAIRELKSQPQ